MGEQAWLSRWRWRMRGAWQWPLFAVLTILDTLLLHARPLLGDGIDVVPAFILSGFLNLIAVALLAPFGGWLVRRRRPDLPGIVARDYAGSALLVLVAAGVLAGGLVHHSVVVEQERALAAAQFAVHGYVLSSAPAEYRPGAARADFIKVESGMYRACVPGRVATRPLCLIIRTTQSPPGVTLAGHEPNASFSPR